MAKALGRRGGRARAKRLSAIDRKRIASLGGHARRRSLQAARRIAENLRYAAVVEDLRRQRTTVKRLRAFTGRLPGIYPDPGGFAPAGPPRRRSRGPLPRSAPAGAPVARLGPLDGAHDANTILVRRRRAVPGDRDMPGPLDHLQTVGEIIQDLRALGLAPVLVGGMALVVIGSRRVTRDFDFVISQPADRLARMIAAFYDRGLELVSRLNETGDVISTISSRKIAAVRLRLDAPGSAYFFNARTGLRVDLLFDFPIPATTLAAHATRTRIRAQVFDIASEQDLLRLKRIARAARSAPGDAEDIVFLESRKRST